MPPVAMESCNVIGMCKRVCHHSSKFAVKICPECLLLHLIEDVRSIS